MRAFLSYAHADPQWYEAACKWLKRLRHSGIATFWTDHELVPGELWDSRIRAEVDAADVVIFLVTQNFERSDYINHVEVDRAIAGARAAGKLLIAVHCEPSTANHGPLRAFQAVLARGGSAISQAPDVGTAWQEVYTDVADACERYRTQLDLPALNQRIVSDKTLTRLPPLFAGDPQRSLASLYVELRLLPRVVGTPSRPPAPSTLTTLAARQLEDQRLRHAVNLSLEQAIAMNDAGRFVVAGDPGSGKSSIMRRMALDVAERKGAWQRWDCAFLVGLRRLARNKPDGARWTPELFLRLAFEPWLKSDVLAERAAKLYAQGLTGAGRLLLLFDGLDEIAADPATHEDICDIIGRLPAGIDWIVTSRITGLFGDLMEDQRYEIAPLDEGGVEALVTNWFADGGNGAEPARLLLARRLLSEIAHNARLVELARNPFLLSAVCFLREREPDIVLPLTRASVYRRLFEQIARQAWHHYGDRTILDAAAMTALETFAHWTYERGGTAPLQIFHAAHWQECGQEAGHAVDLHRRILPARLLIQESELTEAYHFVHLSLHEYLVARGCLRERLADVINLRYRPQWRPVIQFVGVLLYEDGRHDDFRRLACAMAEPPDLTHRMLIEVAQLFLEAGIDDTRPFLGYDLTERLWTAFCEGDTYISRAALQALWRAPWTSIEPRFAKLAADMRARIAPLGEAATRFDVRRRYHPNPYLLLAGRRDGQSEDRLLDAFLSEPSEDVAAAMVEAVALSLSRVGRPQAAAAARTAIGTPRAQRFLLLLEEAPHPDFLSLLDDWISSLDPDGDNSEHYRRLIGVLRDVPGDASVPILEREAMRCLAHPGRSVRLTRVTEIAYDLSRVRTSRRIEACERIAAETRKIDPDQADTIETATEPFDESGESLEKYIDDFEDPFDIQRVLNKIAEAQAQDLGVPAELVTTAVTKLETCLGALADFTTADFAPWAALLNVDRLRIEAGEQPVLGGRVVAALVALVAMEHAPLDPDDPAGDWQDVEIPGVALEDEGLHQDDPRGRFTALSAYAAAACPAEAILDPMLRVAAAPMSIWGRASRCSALTDIAILADREAITNEGMRRNAVSRLTQILAEATEAGEELVAEHCAWAIGCIDLQELMQLRNRFDVIETLMRFSSERDYLIYATYAVTPDGRSDVVLPPLASLFVVMDIGYDGALVETFLHHAMHWGFEQAGADAQTCLGGVVIAPHPTSAKDLDAQLRDDLQAQARRNPTWPVLLIATSEKHAALVARDLAIPVASVIVPPAAATSDEFAAVRSVLDDWLSASCPPPRVAQ